MSTVSVISQRYDYDSFDKVTLDGNEEADNENQSDEKANENGMNTWFSRRRFILSTQDLAFLFCVCFSD